MKYSNFILSEGNAGGDKIEKCGWPLFGREKFPNYELFWQKFIVPLTGRNADIVFRSNTSKEDREIASIHYAIFHNFYVIYSWLQSSLPHTERKLELEDQFFEYSFIKLSNTCDLVEELLFNIFINTNEPEVTKREIQSALDKNEENQKKVNDIQAAKILEELLKTGTAKIILASRIDILSKIHNLTSYCRFSGPIRKYRNIIVHSWQSFKFNNKVPKIECIKKYQDWLYITEVLKSADEKKKKEMIDKDFIEMRSLTADSTDKLISLVNELWAEVIPKIPENNKSTNISSHAGSASMSAMIFTSNETSSTG